ncbi:DMT family transporter [Nocardia sp. CDC159]|uniref:DMT family transporter n=1 Tax=Nocardia pulmonis TaxID=2951408 RepID=A0A9X2E5Z0_9NOCA|nr:MULTISPECIES: DMT family transporter [Nocardia]MCM6773445.1 DMT family transporter [Nocardia pulmonis]MCM6786332.1 DMT family transporter [Nocardia sp. CDC159]
MTGLARGEVVGGVLALLSASLFAVAASLQQGSARRAALADARVRNLAIIGIARTLVTNRRWLVGQGASATGFVLHAAALRYGALSMVQALLVMQLLFALPLAAGRRQRPLLRRDWAGTAAVCCGLVVLILHGVPHGALRVDRLPAAAAVVAGAVVVLLALARTARSPQLRSALIAMASGCCVATTAVLVSIAAAALPELSPALLGVPISTTVGALLTQEAFARGSLPTALTTMTITDPVLSYTAGLTLFVTTAHVYPLPLALAAGLIIGGVALLANSPTLHDEKDVPQLVAVG